MTHLDRCTHISAGRADRDILIRKNFDVNMRLFHANDRYRRLVQECCDYIVWQAMNEVEGYKKPHGYSGANAGIPFRIIALADGTVMINPEMRIVSEEMRRSISNCASLTLNTPIEIERYSRVYVTYYNRDGKTEEMEGYLPTVQHEIDHTNGILITDRMI